MAIKPPDKPPGSITQPADTKNERIAEVSNVNRVVSEMQQKVDQQLAEANADIGEFEGIEEVQSSMIKVLSTLNRTVGSLGHGFAKIASETSQVSTDAIKQYGKAISADIGLNKQNIVATALAQSSPIFGYFAAKFVETDVFQAAKEKMKTNISAALGGITSKFKEGFAHIIGRAKAKGEKEKPVKRLASKEKIPKMQHGGYVEKGGMAALHPAEVVVPIDKILSRIDEAIGTTKELALISRRAQLNTLAKMSTYVATVEKLEKVGIFKGFMKAMSQVHMQYTEPADIRSLRALLAIQDALGAQIGTMQQVWQKMLVNHPVFRNITFAMRGLGAVFGAPFKFAYNVFKSRGGYQAHLSTARNPMKAMVENIGLVYSEGMWRLDNIALYTRAAAEATRDMSSALTGKKYPQLEGVPTGLWSLLGLSRTITNWITKHGTTLVGKSLGFLLKDKEFGKLIENVGLSLTKKREFIGTRVLDLLSERRRKLKEAYGTMPGSTRMFTKEIEQETRRVGALPVSEIHLDRFVKNAEQYMIENKKQQRKLLGYTGNMSDVIEGEFEITKEMNRREKRRTVFGFLGAGLGAVKSLLGGGLAMILPMITGTLLPWAKNFFFSLTAKLFPKGIIPTLIGVLASPTLWAAISAAILGTVIGKTLDKLLGISSGFKASLERMDKRAGEAAKIQTKVTKEKYERARGGGIAGYESVQELKLRAQLGSQARAQSVGMFGRANLLAINSAQQKYMHENINEYLKYGPAQIQELRSEWIKGEAFRAKRIGSDPEKYGREREAAFLKYIQAKGTIRSAQETDLAYKAYAKKIPLKDRMGQVWKEGKEFAKEQVSEKLVQAKAFEKGLENQAKKIVEGTKELGTGIATSVTQASNAVTTSIQNTSSTVNQTSKRIKDIFSEYDYAVIRGDHMSEDF